MKKNLLIVFFAVFLSSVDAAAYEVNVHERMAANAMSLSNIISYLDHNLSISATTKFKGKSVSQWLQNGANWEDASLTMRWLNHFYDPKTGNGLSMLGEQMGQSSLVWAKGYYGNLWSWYWARDAYYNALINSDLSFREFHYANLFRSLGQVIHLVHDLAVPSHVRNDAHNAPFFGIPYDLYEIYTQRSDVISTLTYTGYPVVDLAVFNSVDAFWINNGKGLAEFTNRSFLSRNTNFDDSAYQNYNTPIAIGELVTTETISVPYSPPLQVEVRYMKGEVADYNIQQVANIDRLTAFSYFDYEMKKFKNERVYTQNNLVCKDYARFLVPRAVGYSAGLLNYFFRGSIEIAVPTSGFYALAAQYDSGFTTIKLQAQNITENNEQMPDGSLQLVVKYQPTQDAPFTYRVASEATGMRTIPRDNLAELTFDLSQNPIPFTATDVYLQLVYHGRLGNEDGAVAVGFKDISEPTPIDIYNNMDKICINGSWFNAGSPEAIDQVGTIDGIPVADVYSHNVKTVYTKISPSSNPQWATPELYDFMISDISPASLKQPAYILVEHEPEGVPDFYYSHYDIPEKIDSADNWGHGGMLYRVEGDAFRNQIEYVEDPAQCDGALSCYVRKISNYYTFRGQQMWWGAGFIYTNVPYPADAQCTLDSLE